ncbi:MAG: metal ABC transporter permease [Simkaniaceae bacterium]|nr:metal ABC transporter permease [Simkaniaceae bacterium]
MLHPYWGKDFFGFFAALFGRIFSGGHLVTDEVQLLTLFAIGISASVIGTFLILQKMSMLANSLAHTVLFGIVVTYLGMNALGMRPDPTAIEMPALIVAALVTALVTTFSTTFLKRRFQLQEDASMALVFTTFFALGILLVTIFTRNAHIGVEVITGNIDALHPDDVKLSMILLLGNLVLLGLLYRKYTMVTFDPKFARAIGLPVGLLHYVLMVQTSATTIGSFRAVGVFLFLAFLVGPPLAARMITKKIGHMILVSSGIAIFASLIGVALSRHCLSVYHLPLSTSGIAVAVIGGIYFSIGFLKKWCRIASYGATRNTAGKHGIGREANTSSDLSS